MWLGLPVKVTSALCQASKTVHYLSDWSGTCQVATGDADSCENHAGLSASTFYKGFTVLVAPQLINETYGNHLKEVRLNTCKYFCSTVNFMRTIFDTNLIFTYRIALLISAFQ
jgi:hypothetical protein